MRKLSVKWRVTLWYALIMVVLATIILFAMTSLSRRYAERDMTERLYSAVNSMSRQMSMTRPIGGPEFPVPPMRFYMRGVHMAVYDEAGTLIDGQIPFEIVSPAEFLATTPRVKTMSGAVYCVYDKQTQSVQHGTVWVRGVVSLTEEYESITKTFHINLMLTLILILIAAVGGYLIISRAFVPVSKIRKTALAISESKDLSARIHIGNGKDEICQLANTFDEMLDKIEQNFAREKQFTADASHELRTPVSVILSECEFVEDCAETEEDYKESVASIRRQADKMSRLINELLMFARMDAQTLRLNIEQTDLSEMAGFVADEQADIYAERGIRLVRNIDEGICAPVDHVLLTRAMINLVSNAYQYSAEGDTVTVALSQTESEIVFSVADTGIGIAEAHLPKIWERFYQVDPSRQSKENGSAGLGLSMVKWIAQQHGGSVHVESTPDVGSTFVLRLPK